MSNSDVDHLEYLKLARDKVTLAIANGEDATTVTMGPKSGEFKARDSVLRNIEKEIQRYESKVNLANPNRSRRNRARLKR